MSAIAAIRSVRAPALAGKRTTSAASRRAPLVAVRAAVESAETVVDEPVVASGTVFYRGQAYSEAEYNAKKASGEIDDLSKVDVAVYAEPPSFGGKSWGWSWFSFFLRSGRESAAAAPSCFSLSLALLLFLFLSSSSCLLSLCTHARTSTRLHRAFRQRGGNSGRSSC